MVRKILSYAYNVAGDEFYVWGAHYLLALTEQVHATSYIPTQRCVVTIETVGSGEPRIDYQVG